MPTIVLNVVVGVMHWFYSVLLFLLGNVVYFVLFERQCCDVVPMIEVVIQRVVGLVIFVVLKIVIVVSLLMNSWQMMGMSRGSLFNRLFWNSLRNWFLWDSLYDRLWWSWLTDWLLGSRLWNWLLYSRL